MATLFVRIETAVDVPGLGLSPTVTYWRKDAPTAPVGVAVAMTELTDAGAGPDLGVYFVDVATVDGEEYIAVFDCTASARAGTRYQAVPFSGTTDERIEVDVPAILADTAAMQPLVDVAVSTRSSHTPADVDTTLTAAHGAGAWTPADVSALALEASVQTVITTGGAGPWTTATVPAVIDANVVQVNGVGTTGIADFRADVSALALEATVTAEHATTRANTDAAETAILGVGGAGPWTTADLTGIATAADVTAAVTAIQGASGPTLEAMAGAGFATGTDSLEALSNAISATDPSTVVAAGIAYSASAVELNAEVFLVRDGGRVTNPTSATIDVFFPGGTTPVASDSSSSPNSRGVFSFTLGSLVLTPNVVYTVDVSVTDATGTVVNTYNLPIHA